MVSWAWGFSVPLRRVRLLRRRLYRLHIRRAILLKRVTRFFRRASLHQPPIPHLPARLGILQAQSTVTPSRPNLPRQAAIKSQLNRHLPARRPGTHVSCLALAALLPRPQSTATLFRANLLWQAVTQSQRSRRLLARLGTRVSCLVSVAPHPQPQPAATPFRPELPRQAVIKFRLGSHSARLGTRVSCLASGVPLPLTQPAATLSRPDLPR